MEVRLPYPRFWFWRQWGAPKLTKKPVYTKDEIHNTYGSNNVFHDSLIIQYFRRAFTFLHLYGYTLSEIHYPKNILQSAMLKGFKTVVIEF